VATKTVSQATSQRRSWRITSRWWRVSGREVARGIVQKDCTVRTATDKAAVAKKFASHGGFSSGSNGVTLRNTREGP